LAEGEGSFAFSDALVVRHSEILSSLVDGICAVTTEAPQQAYGRRGRIPDGQDPSVISSDALVAAEVQSFLQ
jgi:hypothetical protein